MLPAVPLSFVAAAIAKYPPGCLNFALAQTTPSGGMAMFQGAIAAICTTTPIVFGLILYRMIFGREHVSCTYLRPWGALLAGALFGLFGGFLIDWVVAGTFVLESYQIIGWLPEHMTKKPALPQFMHEVLSVNLCGWLFVLNGLSAGLAMAMVTNRIRSHPDWLDFLKKYSQPSMAGSLKPGSLLRRLLHIVFRCSWPIPTALGATTAIFLGMLFVTGKMEPNEQPFQKQFFGGMVEPHQTDRIPGQPLTPAEEKSVAQALVDAMRATGPDRPITQERRQTIAAETLNRLDSEAAKKQLRAELREWKTSAFGRTAGALGDIISDIAGAFFGVVGMGIGVVILHLVRNSLKANRM
jgi:hypothetical protein